VVNETFRDKVMIAGFVEQHVHPVLAGLTMPSVVISIEPWDTVTAVHGEDVLCDEDRSARQGNRGALPSGEAARGG
jgi:hypothetical protein